LAIGEAHWYVARDQQDANAWIYFTTERMAQPKVCFVDNYGTAGWHTRPRGLPL